MGGSGAPLAHALGLFSSSVGSVPISYSCSISIFCFCLLLSASLSPFSPCWPISILPGTRRPLTTLGLLEASLVIGSLFSGHIHFLLMHMFEDRSSTSPLGKPDWFPFLGRWMQFPLPGGAHRADSSILPFSLLTDLEELGVTQWSESPLRGFRPRLDQEARPSRLVREATLIHSLRHEFNEHLWAACDVSGAEIE